MSLLPPKTAAERLLDQRIEAYGREGGVRTTLTVYKGDLERCHRLVERLGPGWNNHKAVATALEVLETTLNELDADRHVVALVGKAKKK